jgi:hypothetical protein
MADRTDIVVFGARDRSALLPARETRTGPRAIPNMRRALAGLWQSRAPAARCTQAGMALCLTGLVVWLGFAAWWTEASRELVREQDRAKLHQLFEQAVEQHNFARGLRRGQ